MLYMRCAPTQSELTESEVITFLLFTSLVHVSMKLNHKYNFKSYINCCRQKMANPSLKMSGHRSTIGESGTPNYFLIHHLN